VDQFPSNSHTPRSDEGEKPAEKVVTKIVSGNVSRKKKPLGIRFREMFFPHAEVSVVEYVVGEILVPALKDMMTDAVSEGFARMLNGGESRSSRRRPSSSGGAFGNTSNRVNYTSYSAPARRDERPSRRSRVSNDFDDVVLDSRKEAEDVINTLIDIIDKYDVATVQDMYELVGLEFHHTDSKWGWTNLNTAGIRRVGNQSYLLVLPKPEAID
jgi:hypothetical protein